MGNWLSFVAERRMNWKLRVVMMPTLSSLVVTRSYIAYSSVVVIMAICGATSDDQVGIVPNVSVPILHYIPSFLASSFSSLLVDYPDSHSQTSGLQTHASCYVGPRSRSFAHWVWVLPPKAWPRYSFQQDRGPPCHFPGSHTSVSSVCS